MVFSKRNASFLLSALFSSLVVISAFAVTQLSENYNSDFVDAVWVADEHKIIKISADDGSTLLEIKDLDELERIAIDSVNGVIWTASEKGLSKYSFTGELLLSALYKALPGYKHDDGDKSKKHDDDDKYKSELDVEIFTVDPKDGSLWLATEKAIFHYSAQGEYIAHAGTDKDIQDFSLSPDKSEIWIATKKAILNYPYSLDAVKFSISLKHVKGHDKEEDDDHSKPRSIDYDSSLSQLWVLTEKQIHRYDDNGNEVFNKKNKKGKHLVADQQGNAWVASKKVLQLLDKQGQVLLEQKPFNKGDKKIRALALDHADQSVWLASKKQLVHINVQGEILHLVGIKHKIEDIAVYSDVIAPILTFIYPKDQDLLKDNYPTLEFGYNDNGIGVDTSTLALETNGVAGSILCTHQTETSSCSLVEPLPEGDVSLSASVADFSGNKSEAAQINIHIDTIPPELELISPEDGSYTNQPVLTLVAQSNEAGSVIITHNSTNTTSAQLDSQFRFTSTHTLTEGNNIFAVTVTDLAGNSTSKTYSFVLDTIPPEAVVEGLLTVSPVIDGQVSVTGDAGSVEADAYVTVTNQTSGESITVKADSSGAFSLSIAAQPGDVISIVVSDRATNQSPVTEKTAVADLPPDPATVATNLSQSGFTPLYEATAFLYTGSNPIQTGVVEGTIDAQRAAIIRGKVTDRNNNPVPGVVITIQNHPEYGQTKTRLDGIFDMAVNGGPVLTVNYEKEGLLPVQRKVDTPWHDYVWAEDIVMIPLDDKVSTIDLNAQLAFQVAQGNPVTDADGTRQATVLFPQGTTASMTLADGTTQAISTLNVRATEYTVGDNGPNTMPGELPALSGYTYAVELSVDEAIAAGATKVSFSQSLPFYVDNFLDFPVGESVPIGWYDKAKAVWVPSDDGRVIKILSVNALGQAEIDIEGQGQAADAAALAALGITDNERTQLAGLYSVGTTLWRSLIDHFTPWDCNWPYGPPDDAVPPPASPEPDTDDDDKPDDPDEECNSIIECQGQVLGESVEITGTPYTLNYRSDRVEGRRTGRILRIPVTGATVPSSVKNMTLDVSIAGKRFISQIPRTPNYVHELEWDGLDAYGRETSGTYRATIKVTYSYPVVYYSSRSAWSRTFSRVSSRGTRSTGRRGSVSTPIRISRQWNIMVNLDTFDAKKQGFGAWTLDQHHSYDPVGQTLVMGNGKSRAAKNLGNSLIRFAGGYQSGDDIPALDARLSLPNGIAVDEVGNVYVAETGSNKVRIINTDGVISTIAGDGTRGYSGDNGPASQAQLNSPIGMAIDNENNLYIADSGNSCIRKVDTTTKIITTFAGICTQAGFKDDPHPYLAQFRSPTGIAIARDGNIFVADRNNHRIRHITPDGGVNTIAGNGWASFRGDNGPALSASLYFPNSVTIGHSGELFISDTSNRRIRKVNVDGIISTVAGGGASTTLVDFQGPATEAYLAYPVSVAADENGGVYIVDQSNNRIRYVDAGGNISAAAGDTTNSRLILDRNYALNAYISSPSAVVVGKDRKVYFTEYRGNKVSVIAPELDGYSGRAISVVSQDGKQRFIFDHTGRHLRTVSTMNEQVLYSFAYDANGFLSSVTDGYGNMTAIQREQNGVITGIVSPDNHISTVLLDQNGYLASLENPAGEKYRFVYTAYGLLTSMIDPENNASNINYDVLGNLVRDENAEKSAYTLAKSTPSDGYEDAIQLTFPLGSKSRFEFAKSRYERKRKITYPDNTSLLRTTYNSGSELIVARSGATSRTNYRTDPRFGMLAPYESRFTMSTNKLNYTESTSILVELDENSTTHDALKRQTTNFYLNGNRYTEVYDAVNSTYTTTSPEQRVQVRKADSQGKTVYEQLPGLSPREYLYDNRGRPVKMSSGTGNETRETILTYGADGYVNSATNAMKQSVTFEYDGAGRVTKQNYPDGRSISYTYDKNGNTTSIVPPGRSAHVFSYNSLGKELDYTSPAVAQEADITQYRYNLDKRLTGIQRPDGQQIEYVYNNQTGRLTSITTPRGVYQFGFSANPRPDSITAPDGSVLNYVYDTVLLAGVDMQGDVRGKVGYAHNRNLLLSSLSVNDIAVNYLYDRDNKLTNAGVLKLTRNTQTGLIEKTEVGEIRTSTLYNGFGEISQEQWGGGVAGISTSVEGGRITADTLLIKGNVKNATSVTVNGIEMTVSVDGDISGEVPLEPGNNYLDTEIYNKADEIVATDFTSVYRYAPRSGFNIMSINDIAANGDIYFTDINWLQESEDVFRLPAGTGVPEQPEWLLNTQDASVDSAGNVYMKKYNSIWVYDGTDTRLVREFPEIQIGDMVVGHDDHVYVISSNVIYRISPVGTTTELTIPGVNFQAWSARLNSSAWGTVANLNNKLYKLDPNGNHTYLYDFWVENFSLSSTGIICGLTEGLECRDPAGQYVALELDNHPQIMQFDDSDTVYYSTGDNIRRFDASTGISVALITSSSTPIQGSLVITGGLSLGSYKVNYERNKLGHIVSKTEEIGDQTDIYTYSYDSNGRITAERKNDVILHSYTYDENGNRTHVDGVLTGEYDEQDRMIRYANATYTYTRNGELSSKTEAGVTTHYNYDVLGNLMKVRLPGDLIIDYVVDAQNRRVGKKVNGQLIQGFLYRDQLRPVAELDANNLIVSRFVYADKPYIPAYMIKAGITYRIISDHLGSPRLVVNTTDGSIVQQIDYDIWGRIINDTNPGFQPFGYAGGLHDLHTGLVRFGARDYDTQTGRWTVKDPILFDGGQANIYAYVRNNPINYIDPQGLIDTAVGPRWFGGDPFTFTIDGKEYTSEPKGPNEFDFADDIPGTLDINYDPETGRIKFEYQCPF